MPPTRARSLAVAPAAVLVLAALVLPLAGCIRVPLSAPPKASASKQPNDHKPRSAAETRMPKAGIFRLPSGRIQVIGRLQREAEAWVVVAADGADLVQLAARAKNSILDRADSLYDDYVVAEGMPVNVRGDYPLPVIEPQVLRRIEAPVWGKDGSVQLDGIPPRWARIEKPGVFALKGGRVRVVGSFESAGGEGKSWQVVSEMPFLRHAGKVLAVLAPGSKRPRAGQPYGAVEGTVIGYTKRAGVKVPVVKATSFKVVTTMKPTTFERVR